MKKASSPKRRLIGEEIRAEYDFDGGVRGKYAEAFAGGTNLVVLAPDVAAEFRTSAAVNKALRAVIKSRKRRRTA